MPWLCSGTRLRHCRACRRGYHQGMHPRCRAALWGCRRLYAAGCSQPRPFFVHRGLTWPPPCKRRQGPALSQSGRQEPASWLQPLAWLRHQHMPPEQRVCAAPASAAVQPARVFGSIPPAAYHTGTTGSLRCPPWAGRQPWAKADGETAACLCFVSGDTRAWQGSVSRGKRHSGRALRPTDLGNFSVL